MLPSKDEFAVVIKSVYFWSSLLFETNDNFGHVKNGKTQKRILVAKRNVIV